MFYFYPDDSNTNNPQLVIMGLFSSNDKTNDEINEEIDSVIMAVEDMSSHMNAIDNAVQHHDQEIDQIVEALTQEERVFENIEDNAQDITSLKKVFRKFSQIQSNYIQQVDVLDSELSETDESVSKLETRLTRLKKGQDALFEEINQLKEKLDELESEFILDTNRQEWDIETKVEKTSFESHQDKVDKELSKLRASINNISDKIENEKIEIDN